MLGARAHLRTRCRPHPGRPGRATPGSPADQEEERNITPPSHESGGDCKQVHVHTMARSARRGRAATGAVGCICRVWRTCSSSSEITLPSGLLGEVRNTTLGRCSSTAFLIPVGQPECYDDESLIHAWCRGPGMPVGARARQVCGRAIAKGPLPGACQLKCRRHAALAKKAS